MPHLGPEHNVRNATILVPLFATCALPGCHSPVVEWGEVCADCLAACGTYLRPARSNQPPLTEQVLAERDAAVAQAMRAQQAVAAEDATTEDPERRRNQRCWLCEERHTCTKTAQGWECDNCRAVQ